MPWYSSKNQSDWEGFSTRARNILPDYCDIVKKRRTKELTEVPQKKGAVSVSSIERRGQLGWVVYEGICFAKCLFFQLP